MLHVTRKIGQLRISSLARSRPARQLFTPLQIRNFSHSSHRGVFKLSDDDLQRMHEAAREALRRQQLRNPEPYVKPDRRYRGSSPYRMLEYAFESAETEELDNFVRGQLWEAYQNAKYRIKNLPTLLSDRAWDLLWRSQDTLAQNNPHRAQRLKKISDDRKRAGLGSTFPERLARLEALFARGCRAEALQQWQREHDLVLVANSDGNKPEHMQLGARMFILDNDFERAEDILSELYTKHPSWSPEPIFDLFRSYVRKGDEANLGKALELYHTLESRYGKAVSYEDSDACFHFLMNHSHPVEASRIFKDMVTKGYVATEMTSAAVVQTLQRLRQTYQICDSIKDVNEVFLNMLSVLPLPYHSNLFKRWLMELAARKEIEAGPKVVELMYERGLQPRTVHYNLLIALLFRSNNIKLCSQAESIAWQMLDRRQQSYSPEDITLGLIKPRAQPPRRKTSKERRLYFSQPNSPFFIKRYIPAADGGTYAQLLQHYTKANRLPDAKSVLDHLNAWEASTSDPSITSHSPTLVDAKAYYLLSTQHAASAWAEILALGPTPDSARYNSALYLRLWRDLKNTLLTHEDRFDPDYFDPSAGPAAADPRPTPRAFLAHMTTWFTQHLKSPWERRKATRRFVVLAQQHDTDVATLVAASFKLAGDLPGALVAVQVLYRVFRIPPTEVVVQNVLQQLVNMSVPSRTVAERKQGRESGRWELMMGRVTRVYRLFLQRRARAAEVEGLDAMMPPADAFAEVAPGSGGGDEVELFPDEGELEQQREARMVAVRVETLVELMRFMLEREVGSVRAEEMIATAWREVCGEGVGVR